MKRLIAKSFLVAAAVTSFSLTVAARETDNVPRRHRSTFKTEAGDCVSPTAQFNMDINNVRARLLTGGDAWWNLSEAGYEVPKGDGTGQRLTAIFAGAIWITGLDAGGNLKCAAQRYRQEGDDFWPGPVTNGSVEKQVCNKYDRFFNVLGANIAKARTAFVTNPGQVTLADVPKDVLSWPAKGNPYIATDPNYLGETFVIDDNLAPFHDEDGNGEYDPLQGDYPIIPCRGNDATAYGDQMVFWVFNDVGNQHTATNGQAIGVQVNALAFAFQTTDDINNMTFYNYQITNKSSNNLFQTYVSQWADPDLGNFSNDAVGCDVNRSLGIVYNRTTPDVDAQGVSGYQTDLPLIGIDFFEGPLSDSGQQLGMSSFVYFTNGAQPSQSDPQSAAQYRNYQTCFWSDGTPFTRDGTGYGGTIPTCYLFPGNPSNPADWTEMNGNVSGQLTPGDRRFVQTSGPFTLRTGQPQYVTVGVVFVRPAGGVGLPPNFETTIGPADDKAQALFDACFKLLDGPDAPSLEIREMSNSLIINLRNNPGSNNVGESYEQVSTEIPKFFVVGGDTIVNDTTYNFQGYKLYQVVGPTVSATDLDDPAKAKLVAFAQSDIKDDVSRIINFERNATLGLDLPVLKVDGSNKGIINSIPITEDLFAIGNNKALVNHKTYYYTAIAYAYNNYRPYNQDNPDPDAQKRPYLVGRNGFKIYSAIPHIQDSRNGGTIMNSSWGDGVEVKRMEGQGNGGNALNLKAETIAQILGSSNNFADILLYEKKSDPIGFKVNDPISLKEADFELQLVDDPANPVGATTSWLLRDLTNNDTIYSERNLDRPYEQHIGLVKNGELIDYGFSIKLGTPVPRYTNIENGKKVYDPIYDSSYVKYQNPVEPWLSFLADDGNNTASNWIRSGTYVIDFSGSQDNPLSRVFDDNYSIDANSPPNITAYHDTSEIFEKIINGTWAPYCLTANYALGNTTVEGKPPYVYGPGFKWRNYRAAQAPQNNLDKLSSVDVVITPDKSKWTKCIVFETGEDEGINMGNDLFTRTNTQLIGKGALKGQIRMAYSKDWNDPQSRDYLVDVQSDTGRSWFPGYAINLETGERLNIAFGESSDQGDQNGRDMLWNPTSEVYGPISFPGRVIDRLPYFGGKHFMYVMSTKYDEGASAQRILLDNYDKYTTVQLRIPPIQATVYNDLMWTSIPYLTRGYKFVDGYIPPATVEVHLRVEKPYNRLATSETTADSLPRYQFSTKGMGATEKNLEVAKSALDNIRVVPNPYLGYSSYETDQNTGRVKVTNLPNTCTVTIYSLDGVLIRKLTRAIDIDPSTNKKIEISDGSVVKDVNLDNSLEWDLKNDKGIPVASGVYLFHVTAPGIGERTVRWFGTIRPADTSNF